MIVETSYWLLKQNVNLNTANECTFSSVSWYWCVFVSNLESFNVKETTIHASTIRKRMLTSWFTALLNTSWVDRLTFQAMSRHWRHTITYIVTTSFVKKKNCERLATLLHIQTWLQKWRKIKCFKRAKQSSQLWHTRVPATTHWKSLTPKKLFKKFMMRACWCEIRS